jgi:hypothetical protein
MEFPNITDILILLLGNGLIIALFGFYFQRQQHISQKDFEARKEARDYYKTLYGHIAIMDELTKSYLRSVSPNQERKAETLCFENGSIEVQTSEKILGRYKIAYSTFSSYYLKSVGIGLEIFVPLQLRDLLGDLWGKAKRFDDNPALLENKRLVSEFNATAKKTTDYMERLFGLKEDWLYSVKQKVTELRKNNKR